MVKIFKNKEIWYFQFWFVSLIIVNLDKCSVSLFMGKILVLDNITEVLILKQSVIVIVKTAKLKEWKNKKSSYNREIDILLRTILVPSEAKAH